MTPSAVFICKHRIHSSCHDPYSAGGFSSGLHNSALHVAEMLTDSGIPAVVEHVVDNNGIDRVVTTHRPSDVFIEAIWVVPSKFEVLTKLHPDVRWIVRVHSETPFLAGEGVAVQWILDYIQLNNVYVAFNSKSTYDEFQSIVQLPLRDKILYLPNHYYGCRVDQPSVPRDEMCIHIGCFGAIRPMKNHLIQATAAIRFAQRAGKTLFFHINATRIEAKGDTVLKNLRALFDEIPNAVLIEHNWLNHADFTELVAEMDINMQVSLSETFNIVTADAVSNNVPVVVSDEINWVHRWFRADATSAASITRRLWVVWMLDAIGMQFLNKIGLNRHNAVAQRLWHGHFCNRPKAK